MIRKIILAILVMLNASVYAQELVQLVRIGQDKREIVKALGEPAEKIRTEKSSEYIWGPEEEFWADIPMGAKLEVWRYGTKNGQLNLYFINDSDHLSFKAFAPAGVVYESN